MFGTGSNAELTRKYERVKVQNDIRTSKYINKQTAPVFNCVTPESVWLAPLTRQKWCISGFNPTLYCISMLIRQGSWLFWGKGSLGEKHSPFLIKPWRLKGCHLQCKASWSKYSSQGFLENELHTQKKKNNNKKTKNKTKKNNNKKQLAQ